MAKQRINVELLDLLGEGEYTYKELCDMNIFVDGAKTGNTKKAQITDLKQYFEIDDTSKRGKINILYKREEFKKKKFTRVRKYKDFQNLNVDCEQWNSKGVYIIIDDEKNCYIGSTVNGFRNRFLEHWYLSHKEMQHTYDLLRKNNAKFMILEDMTGVDENEIRKMEQVYLDKYSNDDNYNVINRYSYVVGLKPKKVKSKKVKYRNIKVKEEDYEKVIELLKNNNIL